MKIAVMFCGVIRPDLDSFMKNKNMILECLSGHEIDTYLFSWKYNDTKLAIDLVDNVVLLKEPDHAYVESLVNNVNYFGGRVLKIANHILSFVRILQAIRFVKNSFNKYDYIIYCRPDLEIKINLEEGWLDKEFYVIPQNGAEDGNDQFGIGTPDVIEKAFDFKSYSNLEEMIKRNVDPEQVMMDIQNTNGIKRKRILCELCQLNRLHEDWTSFGK